MKPKSACHPPVAGCRRALLLALAVLSCAVAGGCVHRRFTVRTNPPGARLYVDDYEIGTTPISHDFVYYGTRKIRLVKDGYETLTILQPIPTPWYDLPGIDFFTENLIPYEFKDHRVLDFQMQPAVITPVEQLLTNADQLRRTKNPAVPGSAVPGAAPAGVPMGAAPTNLPPGMTPPGTLPPGSLPPGSPPPSAPFGAPGQFGAPPAAAPQYPLSPGGAGPSTFQPSPPSGGAAPGAAGTGMPGVQPSSPVWPTTPPPSAAAPPAFGGPPAAGGPPVTSGPTSNYTPPSY